MRKLFVALFYSLVVCQAFADTYTGPMYQPGNVQINGGAINATPIGETSPSTGAFTTLNASSTLSGAGFSTYLAAPPAIGITTPNQIFSSTTNALSGYTLNAGHLLISSTAPTITSGFGTSPSINFSNGTASFRLTVGTGGTANSGVITLPSNTNGWFCNVNPTNAPQAGAVNYAAATSATAVQITNYTLTTGAVLAWPASFVLSVSCLPN